MAQPFLTFLVGFLVVFNYAADADNSSRPLTRRRRYLAFPNKAVFAFTMSLLKGIASDITYGSTIRIVTIHELDVLFPLPYDPSPFQLSQTALGQPPIYHPSHARSRRDLYTQLEDLFYLKGFEGRSCVMKALCEADKPRHSTPEENLIQELLYIIFSIPNNITGGIEEEYRTDDKDCQHFRERCPFSIFDMAFDVVHQLSNLYNV